MKLLLKQGKIYLREKIIEQHIEEGLLKKGEIADKYFLTEIEIELPALA